MVPGPVKFRYIFLGLNMGLSVNVVYSKILTI